jgi:hypothetical protein
MLNPKALFLLCLFFFASLGYSQSHRNYQKADLLRAAAERKRSIDELSARLANFQLKLSLSNLGGDVPQARGVPPVGLPIRKFQGVGSNDFPVQIDRPARISPEPIFEQTYQAQPSSAPVLTSEPEPQASTMGTHPNPSRKGFYVLPFIALQGSSDFAWNSFAGEIAVEQKLGFSSGWRMGHKWRNFFVEGDFSYFRNDFKSLSGVTLDFSGEAEGYGVMFNLGANFDLGDAASVFFGVGGGPFSQEYEFKLLGQGFDEEQGVLAYQFFSGVNLYPSEHMLVSLRYRWLKMGKMEQFADRELHLLEVALGHIF